MNVSTHRVVLDIHRQTTQAHLAAKKGDTARRIIVSLSDGGVPYVIGKDCYAAFMAQKPDGNVLYNSCIIQGNQIIYDFTEQTACAAGRMLCEFRLYSAEDALITSPRISIIVSGTVYEDSEVESTPEFEALSKAMTEVAELKANGLRGEPGPQGPQGPQGAPGDPGTLIIESQGNEASVALNKVLEAVAQGQNVVLLYGAERLPLVSADETGAIFTAVVDGQMTAKVVMDADGWLSPQTFQLASKEDANAAIEATKAYYINIVEDEDENLVADKLFDEIRTHYHSGASLFANYNGIILPLSFDSSSVDRSFVFEGTVENEHYRFTVYGDQSVDGARTVLATTKAVEAAVTQVAEDAKTLRVNVSITDYAEDGTGFGLADKTLAEIAAAVNSGRSVCAVDDEGIIYSLAQSDSEIATFLMNLADVVYMLSVFEEGVMLEAYPLVTPEQIPSKTSQLDNDSGFLTVVDLRQKGFATPQMFGAKGDGVTDDTDAIKAALAASDLVYFPSGTYVVKGSLTVANTTLVGAGANTTVLKFAENPNNETLCFLRGDAQIKNMRVLAATDTGEAFIRVVNTTSSVIDSCTIESVEGVYCGAICDYYGNNQNAHINNTTFICRTTSDGGFWIREVHQSESGVSDNIHITNCKIYQYGHDEGLAIWGWLGTVRNVTVDNTEIVMLENPKESNHIVITAGSTDGVCENILFRNCTIRGMYTSNSFIKESGDNNQNISFDSCTFVVPTKCDSAFATGKITFSRCHFISQVQNILCADGKATFTGCVYDCGEQGFLGYGYFDGITLNNNPEVQRTSNVYGSAMKAVYKNVVVNGLNVAGDNVILINVLPGGHLEWDNVWLYGTLAVRFVLFGGAGATVKVKGSHIDGATYFDDTVVGYIVNSFTSKEKLGTANLTVANMVYSFAIN